MRKLCNGHYIHRGESIIKDDTGIHILWNIHYTDRYQTIEDARQAINKYLDGTNTKEPRVADE